MLKACPFCGSKLVNPICRYGRYGRFVMIQCDVCKAQSGMTKVSGCTFDCEDGIFCENAEEASRIATERWNRRTANTEGDKTDGKTESED